MTRQGTGEDAKCFTQQLEACQRDKFPCRPPVEPALCVYESASTPAAQRKRYPLEVEEKQGATTCYVAGTSPPEQTYCPNEWMVTK